MFFHQKATEAGADGPSMDSSALWVFEKSNPNWGGNPVQVGDCTYRIKHATTGLCIYDPAVNAALDAPTLCLLSHFGRAVCAFNQLVFRVALVTPSSLAHFAESCAGADC